MVYLTILYNTLIHRWLFSCFSILHANPLPPVFLSRTRFLSGFDKYFQGSTMRVALYAFVYAYIHVELYDTPKRYILYSSMMIDYE